MAATWNKAIPTRRAPNWLMRVLALFQQDARLLRPMLGVREEMNAEKASKLLQWRPRSAKETVIDCADSLIANKHVEKTLFVLAEHGT